MKVMNLIQDICLIKNSINNTPKIRFILRNKQKKKLDNKISEFLNLNMIDVSNNMLAFLCSLGNDATNNITDLWYDKKWLSIKISSDDLDITVDYYPKSGRFEVDYGYTSYSIYRNTKISKMINKMWEPLTDKIKKRYVDIIIEMAEYISSDSLNK